MAVLYRWMRCLHDSTRNSLVCKLVFIKCSILSQRRRPQRRIWLVLQLGLERPKHSHDLVSLDNCREKERRPLHVPMELRRLGRGCGADLGETSRDTVSVRPGSSSGVPSASCTGVDGLNSCRVGRSQLLPPEARTRDTFARALWPGLRFLPERPCIPDSLHHRGLSRFRELVGCACACRSGAALQGRASRFLCHQPATHPRDPLGAQNTHGPPGGHADSSGLAGKRRAEGQGNICTHRIVIMMGNFSGLTLLLQYPIAPFLSGVLVAMGGSLFIRASQYRWQSGLMALGSVLWLLNITLHLLG